MGYPSDVKSPEGPLPTYVPIPSDHDTPLSELPSAETRRRRLRIAVKHLVVLLFTSFILYHVLKKSNKGVAKISCVDHWAGRHQKSYQLEKTVFGDAPHHPRVTSCDSWTNETSADESTFKFSFPLNSTLDFFARGPFIGSVDYVLADEDSLTEAVEVEITLNGTDLFVGEEHAIGGRLASWLPQSWVQALKSIPKRKPIRAKAKVCQLQDRVTEEANGFVIISRPPKHRHSPWWRHHRGEPEHPEPPHRGREPAPPSPPHSPDERRPAHPHPHPPALPTAPDVPRRPHHPHAPVPPEFQVEFEEERHSQGHDRLSKFSKHETEHRYAHMHGGEGRDHGRDHEERPHHPHPHPHPHPRPRHHHKLPIIHAKVTITIPRGALEIPRLASIFPGLETTVAPGVFDNAAFGDVVFVTKSLGLNTLTAKSAKIITHSTQPINGTYVVHDKLEIVAGQAPIIANITAYSTPKTHSATKIELINNNATIDTSIALLLSKTVEDDGHLSNNGSFDISAVSRSADIVANVTAQPVSSTLHLSIVSKNASVTAFVPPAYEGEFTVITAGSGGRGEPHVNVAEGTEDPAGLGRERSISVREVLRTIIHGTVKWQEKDDLGLVEEAVEDVTGGWILAELLEEEDESVVSARVHPRDSFDRSSVSLVTSGGDGSIFFV